MLGHYLLFNRTCAEALSFYEKVFDTKIVEMGKYGDMPANPAFPISEEDKGLVLHSRIVIDGTELMCADASNGSTSSDNMYVSLMTQDAELVQKAWDRLKEGGHIYLDLSPSFFAVLHGSLQDKFGINWMFTASK
ncbi:MAG: VOC family protein [Lachnospiraceae bacterium]